MKAELRCFSSEETAEQNYNPLAHHLVMPIKAELTEAGFSWIAGQRAGGRGRGT